MSQAPQSSPLPKTAFAPNTDGQQKEESTYRPPVVPGKPPVRGVSLGSAYYTALSAGRLNSAKAVDTSIIQTGSMLDKAAEVRAAQAMLKGNFTPSHIIKNTGLEAKASFYEAMGRYQNGGVSLSQNVKSNFFSATNLAAGKAQSSLERQDDLGDQTAGGVIGAGALGYAGFKAAQAATPKVISVGKGVWDITTTAGRVTITIQRTHQIVTGAFIPYNSLIAKNILVRQAHISGLVDTATSQRIIQGVTQIQNSVEAVRKVGAGIKTGYTTTVHAVKSSYTLVRGVASGTVAPSVAAYRALERVSGVANTTILHSAKYVGHGIARGTVRGSVWTIKRGVPLTVKSLDSLSVGIGGALSSSDDMMVQGVGNAVMLTNYGIKTSVIAGRLTGRAIKTGVVGYGNLKKGTASTVKGAFNAFDYVRQKGLRSAWARARQKAGAVVVNAGKSVVSAVLNLVKVAGQKLVTPLLLIAIVVMVVSGAVSGPLAMISSIFGNTFEIDNGDGTYTDAEIRAYITDPTNGLPALRMAYINDLYNYMQDQLKVNGGTYHIVRFKTNAEDRVIEPTVAGITSVFYTDEELANIIHPIFNAVLLKDYELTVTSAEGQQVLTTLFNKLFRLTEVATVEWCGQSLIDGSGERYYCGSCGSTHAGDDCPNPISGVHGGYTCAGCCVLWCPGHPYSCGGCATDGQGNTYCAGHIEYCDGCEFLLCNGYVDCGSHDVLTVTLSMDGLYELKYEYFERPIDLLASKVNRTPEEDAELAMLKDYLEILEEYIKQVAVEYGGGLTMDDLSGVEWVNGSRVGNQAIIDLALSQVGQVGGRPYWSWYGFPSRVEWCACFVSWCMNQVGHSEVRFSSCTWGGLPYFQGEGRWANGGFTDLVAGDVIFFDWDVDGDSEHTGLVIGTDGEYVYTVEGNSGDTCKTKKYPINSSVILGYGLMNW